MVAAQGSTTRTTTRLADGRELFYYDDRPGRVGVPRDERSITRLESTSELRYDAIQDDWVIIASHRQDRTYLPPADECPLCPTRPGHATEIPASAYDVVVFQNRFPSLTETPSEVVGHEPLLARPGRGRCEVICFSSDHDTTFSKLPDERLRTIADAIVDRTADLSAVDGVEYVLYFENRGEEIGVTLSHPHGQLYAYPFIPPRMRRSILSARQFKERANECLSCSLLEAELRDSQRILLETEGLVAFVPFASRWPFEVHIASRRHVPDLGSLSDAARVELLGVQARVLGVFDSLFTKPMPYIASLVQAPVRQDREIAHVRLEIFSARRAEGKLKHLAGSESAAGTFINDIRPEDAAAILRAGLEGARPEEQLNE